MSALALPPPQTGGEENSVQTLDFPAPLPRYKPEEISDTQILQLFETKIKTLVSQEIDLDVEPERYIQVAVALRNALYWLGKQYLCLGFRPDDTVGWIPASIPGADTSKNSSAAFRYVFNIVRADGLKFAAVLGQRAPHVEMVADDTASDDSDSRAREANALARYLNDKWKIDNKQKDVARHVWRTGPVFLYTSYVANGAKYGWDYQPDMQPQETELSPAGYKCPDCGDVNPMPYCTGPDCNKPLDDNTYQSRQTAMAPVPSGFHRYPKGDVELRVCNMLEMTWPAHAKSIEDCEWLCYEYDEHKSKLLSSFAYNTPDDPGRAKRMRELIMGETDEQSTGGKQIASDAREVLLSQTATRNPRKNIARFSRYWLRPSWYEMLDIEEDERETFRQKYPEGIKLTFIRGELVDIYSESMDDVWSVVKTGTDEKILADSICTDLIPIQDIINNHFNLAEETIMRGIPKVVVDPSLLDRKSLEENDPMPSEVIFAKASNLGDFNKMMAPMPTAHMNENLVPLADKYREMSREIDGVLEAIFGGGEKSQTWREASQRKNQALMQLGSAYDEMQLGWERAYENGIKQICKYSSAQIKIGEMGIEGGLQFADFPGLLQGGWHAEAQEGVPMTHAEEVDRMLFLTDQNNPIVAQKLELFTDQNSIRLQELFSIRGIKSIKVQELEKFDSIVKELKMGSPIPGAIDPFTGMPGPPQPSVSIDMFEDDHNFMAQAARNYLNDRTKGQALKLVNRPGYDNILAWGEAHQAAAAPPPMAPPPGGPGGAGGPQAAAGAPSKPPGRSSPQNLPNSVGAPSGPAGPVSPKQTTNAPASSQIPQP